MSYLLYLLLTVAQSQVIPKLPDVSLVRAVLVLEKPSFFLGEKVPIRYCIENISQSTFEAGFGGAPQRFAPVVTDERGAPAPRPSWTLFQGDEISSRYTVAPGQQHCVAFELTNYARIDKPGSYTVETAYEFVTPFIIDNTTPQPKVFGLMARTTVTFRDPSEAEVRKLIAETSEFGGLFVRPGIYLGPLLEVVREGRTDAIRAIGTIPTPEATRALVALLGDSNPAVVRNAATALTRRMPPALEGTLGTLGGYGTDRDLAPGWQPQFAAELREHAKRLIHASDEWVARAGAFILSSIGEAGDIPDISGALNDAINDAGTSRGLADELTRAAEGIIGRGYVPPQPSNRAGDEIIWLVALGRGARLAGWEDALSNILQQSAVYVQGVAMKRMPRPAPDSSISAFGKLLESSQSELLANTCSVIQRDSLQGLRPQALNVFRKTTTESVFRACGYAVLQLGSPLEYYGVVLDRLTEGGEVAAVSLHALLNVFGDTSIGGRTTIPANEARGLARRWRTFIDRHRADLQARRKLSLDDPDATADLVPDGWSLDRNGKPRWPSR